MKDGATLKTCTTQPVDFILNGLGTEYQLVEMSIRGEQETSFQVLKVDDVVTPEQRIPLDECNRSS